MTSLWYLLRTKPSSESLAAEHLARQGFVVYFPRVELQNRRHGRPVRVIRPLFSRYLFLAIDPEPRALGPVAYTRGITGFVKFGREFATVPARVIEGLRRCADPATDLHQIEVARLFAGARVRVVDGMFGGLEGVFERTHGEQHVVVLLELLGQSARVCLRTADVAAEDRQSTRWQQAVGAAC